MKNWQFCKAENYKFCYMKLTKNQNSDNPRSELSTEIENSAPRFGLICFLIFCYFQAKEDL